MSRSDSFGLFWHDVEKVKARAGGVRTIGPMPPIPKTGWRPPVEFPNLSAAKVIGFDTETYDPELRDSGPGWGRDKSHLIGISMSVEDGTSWYFPFAHETETELNMDRDQVLAFARHALGTSVPKVGANLIYDVGALKVEGVKVGGPLLDIQFAEALLNSETPRVDLDSLGEKYLNKGKETSILYDWLASWLGGKASERQRANMYKSPPSLAGPYAEADASLPIAIMNKQWPLLQARGVFDLFLMECKLINLLVEMRIKGAPVNVNKAEEEYESLGNDLIEIGSRIRDIAGQPVNPNAPDSIKSAFIKLGIPIPRKINSKGEEKDTFAAPVIEALGLPLTDTIVEYRQTAKVRDVFVKSYIIDKNIKGRVHCSFNPLKGDSGGTRSGRFSSSDPNLQNIPARTEIGKRVRTLFEAMQGKLWRKWDFSQIEYRLLAHHAVGAGSDEIRAVYNSDPDTDYHIRTGDMIHNLVGQELERRKVKTINFGLIYGMAENTLSTRLGLSKAEGKNLFKMYHEAVPFAQATMDDCAAEVHKFGYVTTILGRKSDFPMWGTKKFDAEGRAGLPYDLACRKWGAYNIERSFTHKALNRKLQGGAADLMKAAMVAAYEAGLFADDACGMPTLTVHDELDFEDENSPDNPAWKEFKHVMENTTMCKIPIRMDESIGKNWGNAD